VGKALRSPWRCSMIIWHADDMPEHIESMFDDCDYASDASSVLRRVARMKLAGWHGLPESALNRKEKLLN